ncbi:hypothetical protein FSP39_008434 [Pinctada imbricata]|uniref:C2H2-type domain-containing protein n=1 Tax=Pinctada imbricata TaxID=66713 RepID=A0AA89BW02_PINIB|nr:hypothetical protein FSP39_008434 [Pinctada imbricata]
MHTLELLDLDQIKMLSEKYLISYFAELSSNEMTRNFVYTCHLMPRVCKEQFKSFGNENQARLKVKKHLLKHLEQLTAEKNDPSNEGDFKFTAEPLHVRDKKLQDAAIINTKKKGRDSGVTSVYQRTSRPGFAPGKGLTKFTNLKNSSNSSSDNTEKENTQVHHLEHDMVDSVDREEELQEDDSNRHLLIVRKIQLKKKGSDAPTSSKTFIGKRRIESQKQKSEKQRIAENEQFIIDLLSRNQPHHDHSYTTIFGRKRGHEDVEDDSATDDVDSGPDLTARYGSRVIHQHKQSEPILCLGNVSVMDELSSSGASTDEASKTIIVCAEEIIDDAPDNEVDLVDGIEPRKSLDGSPGFGVSFGYPPMPKCPLAKCGRITDDTIFEQDDVDDLRELQNQKKIMEGSPDWERKTALRLIRELKGKKDFKKPLYCKLCRGKTFTATATLIYHYRSHAGIKPFVCLICNTTFTRQHSLNYHMLIHNNQSRFTCKDCGRKFRHPSHFKEHLRRHTGETPFVCTDCPCRFKTRNTYKRHLKTRHGKLLTATGIHQLSVEEFAKIRTRRSIRTGNQRAVKPNKSTPGKYTRIESIDLPLPGKKMTLYSSGSQNQGSENVDSDSEGDSSTISVTGDLGDLSDVKLEIDNALDLEEVGKTQEEKVVVSTVESGQDQQHGVLQDLAAAALDNVHNLGTPYNYNLAVNS